MIYKYAMARTGNPFDMEEPTRDADMEYPVPEVEGEIPGEWVEYWWSTKLDKVPAGKVSLKRMFGSGDTSGSQSDDIVMESELKKEDIYS